MSAGSQADSQVCLRSLAEVGVICQAGNSGAGRGVREGSGHRVRWKREMLVAQSRPTQCDSMGCSPPGSSVHGILQARILEWVAIPFSRASPYPGIEPGSQLCLHCRQILYGLSHQGSPMKSVRGLHNTLGWSVWKLWTLSSTLEPRTRTGCRYGGQEISGGGRDETCWDMLPQESTQDYGNNKHSKRFKGVELNLGDTNTETIEKARSTNKAF